MMPVLAVFDQRYVESRLFAASLEGQGMPTRAITGDVTSLWYDDLYHRWAAGPSPVVGLTGASSLFCLEHLAWKVERRVVLRIEHAQMSSGVEHQITAPAPVATLAAAYGSAQSWPLVSMASVRGLPATLKRGVKFFERAAGPAVAEAGSWEEPLVTWVIAPKARA